MINKREVLITIFILNFSGLLILAVINLCFGLMSLSFATITAVITISLLSNYICLMKISRKAFSFTVSLLAFMLLTGISSFVLKFQNKFSFEFILMLFSLHLMLFGMIFGVIHLKKRLKAKS